MCCYDKRLHEFASIQHHNHQANFLAITLDTVSFDHRNSCLGGTIGQRPHAMTVSTTFSLQLKKRPIQIKIYPRVRCFYYIYFFSIKIFQLTLEDIQQILEAVRVNLKHVLLKLKYVTLNFISMQFILKCLTFNQKKIVFLTFKQFTLKLSLEIMWYYAI